MHEMTLMPGGARRADPEAQLRTAKTWCEVFLGSKLVCF